MNKNHVSKLALCAVFALVGACGGPSETTSQAAPVQLDAPHLGLIPTPRHSVGAIGTFRVAATTDVLFSGGEGAAAAAQYFVELIRQQRSDLAFVKPREDSPESGSIAFVLAADEPEHAAEGYSLAVSPKGVTITARTPAGLFYGAVTLWQIITAEAMLGLSVDIPALRITDHPRFAWRGLMLDSARHFQSPEYIKQFIDWMALHKLNVLHWHLVDDQGWRLEIKKYPKLTSVGAWRVPAGQAPLTDIDPATGKPRQYGGFYTQEQVRDIVAHAAKRNITVVPEIEMPGHATAAVVAYPELGVTNKPPKAVPEEWGIFPTLFNVDDSTFTFLENVLAEVIELFPSPYIHVGGDEALKDEWHNSPKVQARMRELNLKDEHELQSYFIQRIGKFISSKGRKIIGWDEILEGGLAPNATVMSWRGIDGAIAAAKSGHDTVLSPAPDLYLDHWQSPGDTSPGRSNTLSLKDVYLFNPLPESILPEQRKHVLGLQGNLWAEFMRSEARVTYMAFPRAAALAEVAWSPAERIRWEDFEKRLEPQLRRYATLGISYARETPVVPGPRRRVSHDLEQCGDGYLLSLEDDAPLTGERAVFLVNITNPCWVWRAVDLSQVKAIRATVGQIPFNFQIGGDAAKIPLHKPATKSGELQIRIDDCSGNVVASGALERAVPNFGLTPLPNIELPSQEGQHDICFTFTRAKIDPIWAIGGIELIGY
ncbi:MAG TPA: family 20 glycosylhydrolase [Steroidobacteraceae bacterium]|nr:family 20 glycosylhydrolase [Steroidobacteraceae bacterium]